MTAMRIVWHEIRRILLDWVLWVMVAVSLVVNGWQIWSGSYNRDSYVVFEDTVEIIGNELTAKSLDCLEELYTQEVDTAKDRYLDQMGTEAENLLQLYQRGCLEDDEDSFQRLQLWQKIISAKETLLGEGTVYSAEAFIESRENLFPTQVEALEARVTQIQENKESHYLSVATFTDLWQTLYGVLLPLLYAELTVIAVYLVLKNTELEFALGTHSIVFVTRKGRKIQISRLWGCIVAVTLVFVLLSGITLMAYMAVYPQSSALDAPVAAQVYPSMIPKFNLTGLAYLLLNLAAGYGVVLVFVLLAGSVGILLHNSYLGFVAVAGVAGVMAVMQQACQDQMVLSDLLLAWNPLSLIATITDSWEIVPRTGDLFLYTVDCYSAPLFEIGVLTVWLCIGIAAYVVSYRLFGRKEISA